MSENIEDWGEVTPTIFGSVRTTLLSASTWTSGIQHLTPTPRKYVFDVTSIGPAFVAMGV